MATEVKLSVGEVEVKNEQTAPKYVVRVENEKLGELRVSKGGIRWLPRDHEDDAHHINWKRFDEFMRTQKRK
jgi:hypothetical protein